MRPDIDEDRCAVYHGDCLEVLRGLPDASVDAVVTDPPYGLEFMGKEWDSFAPERTKYHGERADTSKNIKDDKSKPSSRHGVSYSMQRPTFRRCQTCSKREFSGSPCVCTEPIWSYEQPAGTPTRMAAFQKWAELWAVECLRVLKPGGHLLAFGGTRTWHRLACAIEDAGFEVRDSIAWLYGSGFPKSLDVSKAIDKAAGAERQVVGQRHVTNAAQGKGLGHGDLVGGKVMAGLIDVTAPATDAARLWQGWGTALKPAHEPIVVARKPLTGTVAANVLEHGTGALNIDGCRIEADLEELRKNSEPFTKWERKGSVLQESKGMHTPGRVAPMPRLSGRWPANVVLDEDQAAELDGQSGNLKPATSRTHHRNRGPFHSGANSIESDVVYQDGGGGASRFFYIAKAPAKERPKVDGIAHPTVKPLTLMRWLCRLVTPPNGLILEPFAGSGTTVEAALLEGFRVIAIEREADYLPLIQARLDRVKEGDDGQLTLDSLA